MPLTIPTRTEIVGALQSYVRTNLPDLDPTVTRRRGYIGGMVKSLGSGLHDWYVRLKRYADREPFPQTATGDFLTQGWWTDITGLSRNPATAATGKAVITGTAGTIITAGDALSSGGQTYTVDASSGIVAQSINVSSLTRDGSTAIVETTETHYLATGMTLTIAGATPSDYNGAVEITVTAANEFTFTVAGTPTTPATGTITASGTWGNIDITADEVGTDGNIDGGGTVTISSPPVGADATATVTFGAIAGGTLIEDIEDFRNRILEALGTDFGTFSAAEIKIVAKQIAGVTRVWVVEATQDGSNGVLPGQVKIYFVRDNDADIFPSTSEIATVKSHIVSMIMPAHTSDDDVSVLAPTETAVDFTFTALSPDTASMRTAITASLEQFFEESVDLSTDIPEDAYRCAVYDTFDSERKQSLASFTMSAPSGDVSIATGELPVLGTITWPT